MPFDATPVSASRSDTKVTYWGFVRWLYSKRDDEVVGYAGDPYHCPIATYLRETDPTREFAVRATKYWQSWSVQSERRLPRWAALFVFTVDSARPRSALTAARARQVLGVLGIPAALYFKVAAALTSNGTPRTG